MWLALWLTTNTDGLLRTISPIRIHWYIGTYMGSYVTRAHAMLHQTFSDIHVLTPLPLFFLYAVHPPKHLLHRTGRPTDRTTGAEWREDEGRRQ